jgi:hypothetical protein
MTGERLAFRTGSVSVLKTEYVRHSWNDNRSGTLGVKAIYQGRIE